MAFDATRRGFFGLVAGLAALPIVARLPAPVARKIERAGAWATVNITSGQITAITILNVGCGYTSSPTVVITSDNPSAQHKRS